MIHYFLLSNIRSRKYTSYIYYVGDFPLLIYVYTCKIKTSRKRKKFINEKKLPYRLFILKKYVLLHSLTTRELTSLIEIVQWCNGSTTDSGPVSPGSSPGWTTKSLSFFWVTGFFHTYILRYHGDRNDRRGSFIYILPIWSFLWCSVSFHTLKYLHGKFWPRTRW